ncbi:MAG: sugar-binding domain-containing protein [Actinomycetota bacterium]|nr:sugar-binding domain-containing protein [Actinomycetota bacterium]
MSDHDESGCNGSPRAGREPSTGARAAPWNGDGLTEWTALRLRLGASECDDPGSGFGRPDRQWQASDQLETETEDASLMGRSESLRPDAPHGTGENERERLAIDVARRYYLDDESMPDLAESFGVSRSTISRLIALARERGWVRIEVLGPDTHQSDAVRFLRETFHLEEVVSVPSRPTTDMISVVGRRAADVLSAAMTNHATIGVAWGETTAAIASNLRLTDLVGCTVVQLNGAGSPHDLGVDYAIHILGQFSNAWNATAVLFPVPAFFDDPATRDALWRERSVQRVLDIQHRCNVAVFSVGSMAADHPSRVYRYEYLDAADRRQLQADGAAGDIATYFFDAHGETAGVRLNERASGLPLEDLRRIANRYCVVAGVGKADALAGALRGGYVTHLIADSAVLDAAAAICRGDAAR